MTLQVAIRHTYPGFALDVSFETASGVTAIFGPSGSGKTSIVNAIAGLLTPDAGRIVIGGDTLLDTRARIALPPHRRRIGYVFQDGRLFPHLTVRQNLLYGRAFQSRDRKGESLDRVADLLGVGALLSRMPARLSGGETQRVNIGRALLSNPRLLLMDEPFASLDDARKEDILPYVERLRDEVRIPIVYVSHSLAEVTRLATSVVLIANGRVAAAGPVADTLNRLDIFRDGTGGEAGAVVQVTVIGHDDTAGLSQIRSQAGDWRVPKLKAATGTRLAMRVRARDVFLATAKPEGISALNVFPGVIRAFGQAKDHAIEVEVSCNGDTIIAEITAYSAQALGLKVGDTVFAVVKTVSLEAGGIGQYPTWQSHV
jgi:molybdate transport system ATP-binding protein